MIGGAPAERGKIMPARILTLRPPLICDGCKRKAAKLASAFKNGQGFCWLCDDCLSPPPAPPRAFGVRYLRPTHHFPITMRLIAGGRIR